MTPPSTQVSLVFSREGDNIFIDGLPGRHGTVHANADGADTRLGDGGFLVSVARIGASGIQASITRGGAVLMLAASYNARSFTLEFDRDEL